MTARRLGIVYSVGAYAWWGLFPLYLKALSGVPALEVLSHRIVWAAILLAGLLAPRADWSWLQQLRRPRIAGAVFLSAAVLSVNWFVYIWAVAADRIADASLGYFINPLVSVLLGVLVLGERLRRQQWAAIALAAAGVVWLTVLNGQLPWIALILAASFGSYGLLRKTGPLGALEGLAIETFILAPFALAHLWWHAAAGDSAFLAASGSRKVLLMLAGPVTAVPLLLFAAGARRIPLSLVGLLQYVGPTLQLIIAVAVFREPFGNARLAGFAFIWAALLAYSVEGAWHSRSRP